MGLSEQLLLEVTQGKADITKELSILLSLMLIGTPDDTTLLPIQCQYDCSFVASQAQWRHDLLIKHQTDAAPLELNAPRCYAPHPGRILRSYEPLRSELKYCA